MLGVNIPDNIEDWGYEGIRQFLFSRTAGFRILTRKLRETYGLQGKRRTTLIKQLSTIHNSNQEFDPFIFAMIDLLERTWGFRRELTEAALIDEVIDLEVLRQYALPVYCPTDERPLTEGSGYIKVGLNTTNEAILNAANKIRSKLITLNELTKELNPSKKIPTHRIAHRNKRPKNINEAVELIVNVEEHFYNSYLKYEETNNSKRSLKPSITESIEIYSEYKLKRTESEITEDAEYKANENAINNYYKWLNLYLIPTFDEFKELASEITPPSKSSNK